LLQILLLKNIICQVGIGMEKIEIDVQMIIIKTAHTHTLNRKIFKFRYEMKDATTKGYEAYRDTRCCLFVFFLFS
jgi:hypothetical protein